MAIFSNLQGTFQKVFFLGSKGNHVSLRENSEVLQGQDARLLASDWVSILRPEAIQFDVTQSSHGLTLHSFIYCNSSGVWSKAQADDPDTLANAVVIEVIDSDNFSVGMEGSVTFGSPHGLTVGEYYFTSNDIAGDMMLDDRHSKYSNPVLFVDSANSYIVLPYRATLKDAIIETIDTGKEQSISSSINVECIEEVYAVIPNIKKQSISSSVNIEYTEEI